MWIEPIDCRLQMPRLADKSISLILTDPPYFIDGMSDKWDDKKLRKRMKPGEVFGYLPSGMKFATQQGRDLQEFLNPIAKEWLRIIKPGGFALCFSQARLVHRAAIAIEDAGFEIRDLLAWQYEGQSKAFSQNHFIERLDLPQADKDEIINQLGDRKTPQLKPQMECVVLAQAPREGTYWQNWLTYRAGLIDVKSNLLMPGSFAGQIMPVNKPKERHGHLTVKPVALLRHLIRIFSDDTPGTLIYDPFSGSGSTGVAALVEGREFKGAELNQSMANVANKRIANVKNILKSQLIN